MRPKHTATTPTSTPTTGTAATYIRVSSSGQEDNESLASQQASCLAYAAAHGLTIDPAQQYREVHTGVELWERPALTRMREAIQRHAIDTVIVHSIDRLARDSVHFGMLLGEAEHAWVSVYFVSKPLDAGRAERSCGPDENLEVERFIKGIETGAAMLSELGAMR
jgi:DNA invertase Pin-like site-specific DNA recombinase